MWWTGSWPLVRALRPARNYLHGFEQLTPQSLGILSRECLEARVSSPFVCPQQPLCAWLEWVLSRCLLGSEEGGWRACGTQRSTGLRRWQEKRFLVHQVYKGCLLDPLLGDS